MPYQTLSFYHDTSYAFFFLNMPLNFSLSPEQVNGGGEDYGGIIYLFFLFKAVPAAHGHSQARG